LKSLTFYVTSKNDISYAYPSKALAAVNINESNILQVFPEGGTWETVNIKTPYTAGDERAVEQGCQEYSKEEGTYLRKWYKFKKSVIAQVVESWTFKVPVTEDGYESLPRMVANTIADVIINECYGEADNPDFLEYLKTRHTES
jgi:hypothetical protein